MTSKELHAQKIVPLRFELQRLEKEYKELFRKECGEKIGETASCNNCALSCVISPTDFHNLCVGGKCTCCNSWCYSWTPENNISRFLRKNHHYDGDMIERLDCLFGEGFLKECGDPEKEKVVMDALRFVGRFDGKMDGDES